MLWFTYIGSLKFVQFFGSKAKSNQKKNLKVFFFSNH